MAAINDLIGQIQDKELRERIQREVDKMSKQKKFGLVFEEHLPECTPLYDVPVKVGATVAKRTGKVNDIYKVLSMSDLFHDDISDEDILAIFKTMNEASWHTFQVLTKRSGRLLELSSQINWTDNIWMGVSVENQKAIYRCEDLKQTGAKVKFISAEPLLESISDINLLGIDWLIVGGESGVKSRPMDESWVIELRDLAIKNNVPFFFKQWGGFNKKANGSELQGKYYKEYPIK